MANACVIVDTGCANIASVKYAVQRLGFKTKVTDVADEIVSADRVILPGVGSANHAMSAIKQKQLTECLQQLTQPVLGFCLGMQLMAKHSAESFSETCQVDCLNVINTQIEPLKTGSLRLPHMGWNTLTKVADIGLFSGIKQNDYFYFVHSFAAPVSPFTLAECEYGNAFSAAIGRNNFMGCQFHPERSGDKGSQIIRNFITLPEAELILS